MSEIRDTSALVQVTSFDVLLDDNMRINWQGFRPVGAVQKDPTVYFTTLPGNGTGSMQVSMITLGAQSKNFPVEVTLLSGAATLDGTPLTIDQPVILPAQGTGNPAELVYTSQTCSLKVCPQRPPTSLTSESASAATQSSGGGDGDPPPPPLPGNNGND